MVLCVNLFDYICSQTALSKPDGYKWKDTIIPVVAHCRCVVCGNHCGRWGGRPCPAVALAVHFGTFIVSALFYSLQTSDRNVSDLFRGLCSRHLDNGLKRGTIACGVT